MHKKVILTIIESIKSLKLFLFDLTYSSIKGPKGNIEFLAWLGKDINKKDNEISVEKVVEEAHRELK